MLIHSLLKQMLDPLAKLKFKYKLTELQYIELCGLIKTNPNLSPTQIEFILLIKLQELPFTQEQILSSGILSQVNNFAELLPQLIIFIKNYQITDLSKFAAYLKLINNIACIFKSEIDKNKKMAQVNNQYSIFEHDSRPNLHYFLLMSVIRPFPLEDPPEEIEDLLTLVLININRYLEASGDYLRENNVYKLFAISLIVTQKFSDDISFNNSEFSKSICRFKPNLQDAFQEVNAMEVVFIDMVKLFIFNTREDFIEFYRMQLYLRLTKQFGNGLPSVTYLETEAINKIIELQAYKQFLLIELEFNDNIQKEDPNHPFFLVKSKLFKDLKKVEQHLEEILRLIEQSNQQQLKGLNCNIVANTTIQRVTTEHKSQTQQSLAYELKDQLNQKILFIQRDALINLDVKLDRSHDLKLESLEFVLFSLISGFFWTEANREKLLKNIKNILAAINQCQEIERQKGTPEELIRPSINVANEQGLTPLIAAIKKFQPGLVQILLQAGADPDPILVENSDDDNIPLAQAILVLPESTQILLDRKPNVMTALNYFTKWIEKVDHYESSLKQYKDDLNESKSDVENLDNELLAARDSTINSFRETETKLFNARTQMLDRVMQLKNKSSLDAFFLVVDYAWKNKLIKRPIALSKFISCLNPNDANVKRYKELFKNERNLHPRKWFGQLQEVSQSFAEASPSSLSLTGR